MFGLCCCGGACRYCDRAYDFGDEPEAATVEVTLSGFGALCPGVAGDQGASALLDGTHSLPFSRQFAGDCPALEYKTPDPCDHLQAGECFEITAFFSPVGGASAPCTVKIEWLASPFECEDSVCGTVTLRSQILAAFGYNSTTGAWELIPFDPTHPATLSCGPEQNPGAFSGFCKDCGFKHRLTGNNFPDESTVDAVEVIVP